MIRMAHWYNRDKRAENVQKGPAMRQFIQGKGIPDKYAKHIVSFASLHETIQEYSFLIFLSIFSLDSSYNIYA